MATNPALSEDVALGLAAAELRALATYMSTESEIRALFLRTADRFNDAAGPSGPPGGRAPARGANLHVARGA